MPSGDEYLRIISWNFVASGLVFVTSSMFQAMGNTIPSLLASFSRIAHHRDSGHSAVATAGIRAAVDLVSVCRGDPDAVGIILLLLRREFRLRLEAHGRSDTRLSTSDELSPRRTGVPATRLLRGGVGRRAKPTLPLARQSLAHIRSAV